MERREFLAACALTCSLPAACLAATMPAGPARRYRRVLLTDAAGAPLRASALEKERNYVFHYPYAGTPCFLLDLGRALAPRSGQTGGKGPPRDWPGGVGPRRSIVAYSAICAHQLSYPTRDISFISYRAAATVQSPRARVIHCCSEHSQYDPAEGARVLAGPASHPLATILLQHDAGRDELHALGTLGKEMFDLFFQRFGFRLDLEYGQGRARQLVSGTAPVEAMENFCRQQVKC